MRVCMCYISTLNSMIESSFVREPFASTGIINNKLTGIPSKFNAKTTLGLNILLGFSSEKVSTER